MGRKSAERMRIVVKRSDWEGFGVRDRETERERGGERGRERGREKERDAHTYDQLTKLVAGSSRSSPRI